METATEKPSNELDLRNFTAQTFTRKHYVSYAQWLNARGRSPLKFDALPKSGIMVSYKGQPVACGFISETQTAICGIGNLSSDSAMPNDVRSQAVEALLDSLIGIVKRLGYSGIFIITNKEKLLQRLYKRGFEKLDENLVQVGRVL